MALKNIFKFGKKEKEAEELKSTERPEEEKEIKGYGKSPSSLRFARWSLFAHTQSDDSI